MKTGSCSPQAALPAVSTSKAHFKMVLMFYFTEREVAEDHPGKPSKAGSYLIWFLRQIAP